MLYTENKKSPAQSRDSSRNYRNNAKYSTDYSITYLGKSQIKKEL
nr:MAG TPA: hypothetical protein [Bacteriophage sp.]